MRESVLIKLILEGVELLGQMISRRILDARGASFPSQSSSVCVGALVPTS